MDTAPHTPKVYLLTTPRKRSHLRRMASLQLEQSCLDLWGAVFALQNVSRYLELRVGCKYDVNVLRITSPCAINHTI